MRRIILSVLAVLPLAYAGGQLAANAEPPTTHQAPRVCFPRETWGPAPDRVRPCARIVRLYEDGSLKVRVSDADGTVRYSFGVGAQDR